VTIQRDSSFASHRVKVLGVRSEVSISGSRDERIAVTARLQHGRIAYRQLLALGVSPASIAWLVAKGRLFPSLRCVFCVGHTAAIELGAETDALLSVRDGAALSHWSAAALWEMWLPLPSTVEVTVPSAAPAALNPGVRVHRSRILEPTDLRIRRSLPVTSPARTLLDIAPTATARQLELAFDRALVSKVMRLAEVDDVLARAGGHRGRKRLRMMRDYYSGVTTLTRSDGEERLRAAFRSARLPDPLGNATVAGHEVDLYWPEQRFALELDGFPFHSGRRAFEDDRRKDQDLRRAQVDVMRVTGRQIEFDLWAIIASVASTLARREGRAA
jgi:very-short-patch-repair endonuclease/predicted transcriptional regulator of viral defense system